MYYLKTESSFDAAHFLKDYDGKCRNVHGHCWRVIAQIKSPSLSDETQTRGMIVDFSDFKKYLKALCDKFDHSLIYERLSLKEATVAALKDEGFALLEVPFRPTAENFAEYFFKEMRANGFDVCRVEVCETDKNCAAYEE